MAYLVTSPDGRREFRWSEVGLRRSRRVPRGAEGDLLLAELQAAQAAEAEEGNAFLAEIASAIAEADAERRELEGLNSAVRARLNGMLDPPLSYDHVHGTIVRSDRMSSENIKAEAEVKAAAEARPKPRRVRWANEDHPARMDPTYTLRERLASKFWPGDDRRQFAFMRNLLTIEDELLAGDESPAARLLVGNLVLTWVHGLWADDELLWETHRVGVAPASTAAMTRRAESLSRRFEGALRLWESYCRRTRGEVPAFPTAGANRVAGYFAGAN